MKLGTCRHCGAPLMQGALGCLGCGHLVDDFEKVDTQAAAQTQLGTQVRDALLDTRWRLVQPLGRGRTSTVWLAHDVPFDRRVVVKLLDEHLATDAAAVDRFEQDARRLASIEHKNVVAVLALGRHGPVPFVAMRQAEGRSLAEHLHARGGALSGSEAALICAQLCEAFTAVHASGGPQGGLQPRQVFIAPEDGRVTLLEVRAARSSSEDTAKLTERIEWVAPEVLQGQPADARSDVFTVGAVAWELVCGHAPPRPVAAPQPKGVALPADLRGAIVRATFDDPAQRYATAAELQEALAPFAALHEWASTRSGELKTGAFQALPPADGVASPNAPLRRRTRDDVAVQVAAHAVPKVDPELERDTAPNAPPSLSLLDEPPTAAAMDAPPREGSTRQFDAALLQQTREQQAESWPERKRRRRTTAIVLGATAVFTLLVLLASGWETTAIGPAPLEKLTGALPAPPPSEPTLEAPTPQTVLERAQAFEKQHPTKAPPVDGQLGRRAFKKVSAHTTGFPGMGDFGELHVVVELDGKEVSGDVTVDKKLIGPSPIFLPVTPGKHLVRVDRRPLPASEVEVAVPKGKTLWLDIELLPIDQLTQQ